MLSPLAYWFVLFAVCAYAFARGHVDERLAAAVCVIATIVTWLFNSPLEVRFSGVEVGVFAADLFALFGFTLVALRSERFWPLWVAGLQLTTTLSHMLKAIQLGLMPQAYAAAARFWVYPIFLIIVIGTWRSHQRSLMERRANAA
jgi:hypothetical protein